MIHIGLFEGIGGFSLASRWMGWKTYVTCEIAEFPRKVLQYHFPQAYHHSDIHTLTYETINIELSNRYGNEWRNDEIILTGGFPCQPYSQAGKRLGKEDERHLWPQMLRAIQEIKPTYVVGENVRGLTNWNGGMVFEEVCTDLESCGYEVQPILLPACAVGAPHRRDRIWFVAYCNSRRLERSTEVGRDCEYAIRESKFGLTSDSINNGLPQSVYKSRTKNELYKKETSRRENGEPKCNESVETNGLRWVASNTNGIGLWGESDRIREPKFDGKNYKRNDWKNFPTQSPICGGDDGLPTELDNITFSKWRNESIKAYGNAIVPGIAYEIFKAINLLNE